MLHYYPLPEFVASEDRADSPPLVDIGAFATILDDIGRVLLIRRRDLRVWEAPGGGAGADEPPWEAVVREVREETGVAVAVERLGGVYWRPDKPALILQFLCSVTASVPASSEEAADVRYFALESLPSRIAPVSESELMTA